MAQTRLEVVAGRKVLVRACGMPGAHYRDSSTRSRTLIPIASKSSAHCTL